MFVISLRYLKPLPEIDRFLAEHRAFLATHYANGMLLMSGRKATQDGGVIVANGTRAQVDALISEDPFNREQLAQYEVIEFSPSLTAPLLAQFKA